MESKSELVAAGVISSLTGMHFFGSSSSAAAGAAGAAGTGTGGAGGGGGGVGGAGGDQTWDYGFHPWSPSLFTASNSDSNSNTQAAGRDQDQRRVALSPVITDSIARSRLAAKVQVLS